MKKGIQNFRSKLMIKSHWLILTAALYFGFILNLSFWRYVVTHVEFSSFNMAVFAVSLIFFMAGPFYLIFNLLFMPRVTKPLLILFLLLSSATNYFMYTLGVYIDAEMIQNVFDTNIREATDLITLRGFLWVFATGALPAALLYFTKIKYKPFKKEVLTRAVCMLLCLLIMAGFAATSFKEYASFGRNNREARKLLNVVNYTYSTVRYFQKKASVNRSFLWLDRQAHWKPHEDKARTVLVLVIGETARAKNFSLGGYERETNPRLKQEDIVYFSNTMACGTATAQSLPCMFTYDGRANFNVNDAKYTENLLDMLANAGYEIMWLENDDGCKGVCDRIPVENMVQKGHKKYCKSTYCYDEVLLEGLEERIAQIKEKGIIVMHTMGSHGPTYYNRYPDEFKKFQPTCDTADIQNCSREAIVNTYDNTILYTDHILGSVIETLKKFPEDEVGMLYVSDHGESLGENNIYLHGLPYAIAPIEQVHVPMVLWMSNTMKKLDYVDYECVRKEAAADKYAHDNMFHSVTGLLEVKTKLYNKNRDLFKNCRTKELPI